MEKCASRMVTFVSNIMSSVLPTVGDLEYRKVHLESQMSEASLHNEDEAMLYLNWAKCVSTAVLHTDESKCPESSKRMEKKIYKLDLSSAY